MARRNPSDAAALDPALTQKKRARRRLVGAVVVGIAAAIVLPLVLDSEPRQTITDVEIEIPPREAALPPIDPPRSPDAAAASARGGAEESVVAPVPTEPVAEAGADAGRSEVTAPAVRDAKPATKPGADVAAAAEPEARPGAPSEPRAASKTPAKVASAPRSAPSAPGASSASGVPSASGGSTGAAAAKPGVASPSTPNAAATAKSASAAPAAGARYALQIGAYANAGSARAQLDKARRTGLRAYTEVVKTTQGERTRVRVGPFASREEAEKARATLKLAGMESAVVDAR